MTDETLPNISATIHEQMGRKSDLFWRRVVSSRGWVQLAKWLGLNSSLFVRTGSWTEARIPGVRWAWHAQTVSVPGLQSKAVDG